VLKVVTVAETIIVTGRSPLVDATNTRGGATETKDQTGIVVTGSNNSNTRPNGQSVRMNNSIEGIEAIPGESPDFVATEKVDLKTFGNTADVDLPGPDTSHHLQIRR